MCNHMVINKRCFIYVQRVDTILDSIIIVFHFACFDFPNKLGYSSGMTKLFKPSTVSHILEVDMNEDCHELFVDCLKGFGHSKGLLQIS